MLSGNMPVELCGGGSQHGPGVWECGSVCVCVCVCVGRARQSFGSWRKGKISSLHLEARGNYRVASTEERMRAGKRVWEEGRVEHQRQALGTVPRISLTSTLPLLWLCLPSLLFFCDSFCSFDFSFLTLFPLSAASLLCQPHHTHFQRTHRRQLVWGSFLRIFVRLLFHSAAVVQEVKPYNLRRFHLPLHILFL